MPIDPKDITILLVEDAAVMRKIEIKTLTGLGFKEILEAEDGNVAMEILSSGRKVDLVISDWNMPNRSGLELLVWLRGQPALAATPFLMATGQGDKKQEHKAVAAGVNSFVAKPFNAEELRQKIDEAFGVEAEEAVVERPRTTTGGRVRLRVAHIQITDHLILGVLRHLIEKGEIVCRHFELETECMGGWNPVQNALEKGRVDAAFILAPIAMDLFNYGAAIRLVLLAHKNGSTFVRNRAEAFVPPYADFFRNKSFYIPHQMSVHHMLAHLFFRRIGLRPGIVGEKESDVHFEVVAPVKMPESLKANSNAGGFMVAEPIGTKTVATGIADMQFLSSELWENHPCCVVAVRDDFIETYADAVHEFVGYLVQAGKFVESKPEMAAEIAVAFLDPKKELGLKVPILKNVLTEAGGLRTSDLYPDVEALRQMNRYMSRTMGVGAEIDMDRLVDTRFADAACKDRVSGRLHSVLHDAGDVARRLLEGDLKEGGSHTAKSMLDLEGKYLTFTLAGQEYGIDILKIREIVGMQPIRSVPKTPPHIKGVINLRGRVIPVMDLKERFRLGRVDAQERTCIVVLESRVEGQTVLVGIAVDAVSEVLPIRSSEIEPTPYFGSRIDTGHILAMAKVDKRVRLLLDIDRILVGSGMHRIAA